MLRGCVFLGGLLTVLAATTSLDRVPGSAVEARGRACFVSLPRICRGGRLATASRAFPHIGTSFKRPRSAAGALAVLTGPTVNLLWPALGVNSALALLGKAAKQRWLTSSGLVHAWILGVTLWGTLGPQGWALCVLYLIFGSLVTKVKQAEKEALGIAEKRGGARGPENVWGSAAAGTICALAAVALPQWRYRLQVAYVASLATKLSDTFASEVGKAYGRRTFLITTLKPVPKGTEGAVSLEGTLAGVGGSLIMAVAGKLLGLISEGPAIPITLVAAFIATNIESVLGASLQNDKHRWATNEFINFLNTAIGAALALGGVSILRPV